LAAAWAVASETPRIAFAPRLFLFSVQLDHAAIQGRLIQRVHAGKLVGQLLVDVFDSLQNPSAEVFLLVAIAELPSLVDPGARPARNRCPAKRAIGQGHVDLNGGVSPTIEDLPGVDVNNRGTHGFSLLSRQNSMGLPRTPILADPPDFFQRGWVRFATFSRLVPPGTISGFGPLFGSNEHDRSPRNAVCSGAAAGERSQRSARWRGLLLD